MGKLLEVKNLYKQYKNQSVFAVEDISFTINSGEIVGIVGKNGAGKSSTIKCMIGLEPITKGQIFICGHDIEKDSVKAKQCFGFVPDESFAMENMTGVEYLNFIADIYGVSISDRLTRLKTLEEKYKLGASINNLIRTYSHGMKQKIGIMASVISKPNLWILDEPITGLDPQTTYELKKDIVSYKEQGGVILASHNLPIAQEICTRIIIINKGKLVDDFDINDLKQQNKTLEEYFMEKCKD